MTFSMELKKRLVCNRKGMKWALMLMCVFHSSLAYGNENQFGFGYGQEFKHNTDISQYEIFYRHPLFFEKDLGLTWKLKSAIEISAALIDEKGSDHSPTTRFSMMPLVVLTPADWIIFTIGLGTGAMVGNTNFTDQNLGGAILFSSKVGLEVIWGSQWALGYTFFHQSNVGIYNHNQGLNINQISIVYYF